MGLMRRQQGQPGGASAVPGESGPADVRPCTLLWEFLYSTRWPDGSDRVPGTVLLFVDGGRMKALLNDKDGSFVAFVTLSEEDGVMDALEDAIASPATDWKPTRKPAAGGRR